MSKYGNRKVTANGYIFDSRLEANRYAELLLLVKAGAITDLRFHPIFELQPAFTDTQGRKHRAINYEADAQYIEDGKKVVLEVKGFETAVWLVKKKMFLFKYPELELRVVR